jgi:hypothetical protein
MRIGASLFLLALGAILAFAVADRVSGIDLSVVGWILMAVGALGVILSLVIWNRPTEVTRRERVIDRDVPPDRL